MAKGPAPPPAHDGDYTVALPAPGLTSLVELEHGADARRTKMIGMLMGGMKDLWKILAVCAIFAIGFKMISSFCKTKKADCRRLKPIARFMMWIGWDEFETFDALITVHSVGEIKKDGMLGEKEFKVVINFNWSKWETSPTKDCKWEQSKGLTIPQGATEGEVALYSLGTIKNSRLGGFTLDVMQDMLDEKKKFWNEKKKYKIESGGKLVGTLSMTFRRRGEGQDAMPPLPIAGIDEEGGLAIEVLQEWEELRKTPGYVAPPAGEKLEGERAIFLLSKVLTDELREVDEKGKELGKVYVRTVCCNFADIQGDNRKEELRNQQEKARKKGLTELETKWYWCWYEDKEAAEKKWTHPDGFFPLQTVTQVIRTPDRTDQFVIKHSGGKLKYRRESGKGLDVWVDGLNIVVNACRTMQKDKKEGSKKEEEAMQRMMSLHQQWCQSHGGLPQDKNQWNEWKETFRSNNYDEELITNFYQKVVAPQLAAMPQQRSDPKAGTKAKAKSQSGHR